MSTNREQVQNQVILEALKAGRRLTQLDALKEFGCMRLPARIWDLRHKQHIDVKKTKKALPSGAVVAEYYLEQLILL